MKQQQFDYYFDPNKAAQLGDGAGVEKREFGGEVFTDQVEIGREPGCGVAEAAYIGTGPISDTSIVGSW